MTYDNATALITSAYVDGKACKLPMRTIEDTMIAILVRNGVSRSEAVSIVIRFCASK